MTLPGEVPGLLRVESRDSGMRLFRRAEAAFRLDLLVVVVDLLHLERREEVARLVRERDNVVLRRRVDRETDGQRPGQAVGQMHVLDDRDVVVAAHEALER